MKTKLGIPHMTLRNRFESPFTVSNSGNICIPPVEPILPDIGTPFHNDIVQILKIYDGRYDVTNVRNISNMRNLDYQYRYDLPDACRLTHENKCYKAVISYTVLRFPDVFQYHFNLYLG